MRAPWLPYVLVAAVSVGVGVLVAGLPGDGGDDDTIAIAGATTTVVETTPTTEPEPTIPPTTAAPTTVAPTTTDSVPSTSEPATPPTSEPVELVPREELFVTAANGANVGGTASRMAARLEAEFGYVDVVPRDGTIAEEFTAVYHAPGFEGEAVRLAEDLELLVDLFVGPLEEAPIVVDLPPETELLVYTGRDRA